MHISLNTFHGLTRSDSPNSQWATRAMRTAIDSTQRQYFTILAVVIMNEFILKWKCFCIARSARLLPDRTRRWQTIMNEMQFSQYTDGRRSGPMCIFCNFWFLAFGFCDHIQLRTHTHDSSARHADHSQCTLECFFFIWNWDFVPCDDLKTF